MKIKKVAAPQSRIVIPVVLAEREALDIYIKFRS
jgi:hypothetical protein